MLRSTGARSLLVASLIASLVVAACGGVAAPQVAPSAGGTAANTLYEQAKLEGKVVLYSADDAATLDRLRKGFAAKYPGIDVQGQEGQGKDARELIIAEQAAKKYVGDVVSAGGNTMADLGGQGLLEPFQSPEVANLLPGIADKKGIVNPRYVNVYGITINTQLVPPQDEPKRWKDLADPKFKGKIAIQDPRGSGGGLYVITGLRELYDDAFLADLAKQQLLFGRNNAQGMTDVVRGERSIHMSASANDSLAARSGGGPIKLLHPEEGMVLIPIGLALVKNAPHPNAAKLFINWLLSEDGQKVIAETNTPARMGVAAKDQAADLSNVKVLVMKYDGSDPRETADLSKKYETIFFPK